MTDKTFAKVNLNDTWDGPPDIYCPPDIDSPPDICSYCRQHGIEHIPSGVVYVYCWHTETGAHHHPKGTWTIVENISASDFKAAILTAVLKFEHNTLSTSGMTEQ